MKIFNTKLILKNIIILCAFLLIFTYSSAEVTPISPPTQNPAKNENSFVGKVYTKLECNCPTAPIKDTYFVLLRPLPPPSPQFSELGLLYTDERKKNGIKTNE